MSALSEVLWCNSSALHTTNNHVAELTTELDDAIRQRDELRLELDALRLVLEFDVYCTSMGDSNVFAYAVFRGKIPWTRRTGSSTV